MQGENTAVWTWNSKMMHWNLELMKIRRMVALLLHFQLKLLCTPYFGTFALILSSAISELSEVAFSSPDVEAPFTFPAGSSSPVSPTSCGDR
jgi:hypothetical protein